MGWGGRRDGAGRKIGTKNAIPKGYGKALRTMRKRWRVPEDAPGEIADLADDAFYRIVDVMNEQVHHSQAGNVLKASTAIREEICGPVAKKLEVRGSLEALLTEAHAESNPTPDEDQ